MNTNYLLNLENKSVLELQVLYGYCENGEEFFKSPAGFILIEKLISQREDLILRLLSADLKDVVSIQSEIRAIDSLASFFTQYAMDKEIIREEIENKKHEAN